MKGVGIFTSGSARRIISSLIIGTLLGAMGASWKLGEDLEKLYLSNVQLERQIQDLRKHNEVLKEKLEEMEENIAEGKKIRVENIDLKVEMAEEDEFLQLNLEKLIIKELEENFLNREVKTLDPVAIHAMYHNKLITWEEELYRIVLETLLISQDFVITLRIKKEVLTKN